MHAESSKRWWRILTILIPILALTGCGEGDGQTKILGTAATPLPPIPPGASCDAINFESACPSLASITEFEGGPISIVDNPQVDANNDSARVGQMQKFAADSGATFGGSTMGLSTPFTVVAGSSFTMKVWSPRSVRVLFQPEPAGPGTGVEVTHGGTGWEVLTFDFGNFAATVSGITLIFDNGILGNAGADPGNWTFYFDDITLVSPGGGAGGVSIVPEVVLYATDPNETVDLVVDVDYAETNFGSQSVINRSFADDASYNPVLAVSSGVGYGANIAQIGFIDFDPGFVTFYENLIFKVKGMPNFVIFVQLYEGGNRVRVNLSSSNFSAALNDGWYQVSIPLSSFTGVTSATGIVFESDDTSPMQFTFFLTDIGFSGTVDGGDGGDTGGGDPFDDGLLTNGDFEDGVGGSWIGNALNVVDDGGNFVTSANVEVAGDAFNVNLSQVLAITQDETYTLIFKARSDGARTMLAGIGLNEDPWTNVTEVVNLTAEWQTFELEFTATGFGNANSRVLFDMGADTGLVLIDDVSLVVTGGDTGGGGPFDDGLLTNGDFEDGVGGSWIGNALNVVDDGGNFVTSANVEVAGDAFNVNLSQVLAITQDETYTLTFKARSDGARTMLAGIGLNEDPWTNVTETVNLTAEWQTFELEFTATGFGNANSRVLFDMGADTGLVLIDDVSLVVTTGGGNGGGGGVDGDIAVNGGFETGFFNDGTENASWQQFPNGGIQTIITDNPSAGTYAANLNVPVRGAGDPAVDNLIKNANLEAGNLTPGASVTVSFDMRGSLSGAGGVVFVELFSELSGGGTSKAEIYTGGPLAPNADWTNYSFTTTLGPDVSGGVTLQLKTSCGPVVGCGVDAYFDNVSIVIN